MADFICFDSYWLRKSSANTLSWSDDDGLIGLRLASGKPSFSTDVIESSNGFPCDQFRHHSKTSTDEFLTDDGASSFKHLRSNTYMKFDLLGGRKNTTISEPDLRFIPLHLLKESLEKTRSQTLVDTTDKFPLLDFNEEYAPFFCINEIYYPVDHFEKCNINIYEQKRYVQYELMMPYRRLKEPATPKSNCCKFCFKAEKQSREYNMRCGTPRGPPLSDPFDDPYGCWFTHSTMDKRHKIAICPLLQKRRCLKCGGQGLRAHTEHYCNYRFEIGVFDISKM